MSSTVASQNQRIDWVDQARGFAAVAVMIHHYVIMGAFYNAQNFKPYTQGIVNFLDLGVFGVALFFFISGFIIPYSLIFSRKTPSLKTFITSRLFRLYPAYWVSLVLICFSTMAPPMDVLIANFTMIQRFIGYPDAVGVYWTLQVEILYYVLIAFMLVRQSVKSIKISEWFLIGSATVTLAAAAIRFFLDKKAPLAPLTGLTTILLSQLIYLKTVLPSQKSEQKKWPLFIGVILLVAAFVLGYAKDWGFQENPYKFIISYLTAGAFFFLSQKMNLGKVLSFIGKISFSIYLFHEIIGYLYFYKFFYDLGGKWMLLFGCCLVTLIFSTVIYYTVEKPFHRLAKNFFGPKASEARS